MRRPYEQIVEQAFTKLLAHQRDFVQGEISRLGDINDRSLSRFRSGSVDGGAVQMMRFIDSDFLTVGSTGGSTVCGA